MAWHIYGLWKHSFEAKKLIAWLDVTLSVPWQMHSEEHAGDGASVWGLVEWQQLETSFELRGCDVALNSLNHNICIFQEANILCNAKVAPFTKALIAWRRCTQGAWPCILHVDRLLSKPKLFCRNVRCAMFWNISILYFRHPHWPLLYLCSSVSEEC